MKLLLFIFLTMLGGSLYAQPVPLSDSIQKKLDTFSRASRHEDVVVKANKPVYQFTAEGIVFNVGNTPLVKGTNVWDVLKKIPLLEADDRGGLKIYGVQAATVYINGRQVQFSANDLYNYLKGMPAGNIIKIEVLTSPSSKYDAAAGGIVNIILKRTEEDGLKGNAELSYEQRKYGTPAGNMFLNFHRRRFTQTLTAYKGFENLYTTQAITNKYVQGSTEHINTGTRSKDKYSGVSTTLDYQLNARNNVGAIFGYTRNNRSSTGRGLSDLTGAGTPVSYFIYNPVTDLVEGVSGNLNYKFYDEKAERSLELNVDITQQQTANQFTYAVSLDENAAGNWISGSILTASPEVLYRAVKADYSQKLGNKGASIELGAKYQDNAFESPLQAQKWQSPNWVTDPAQENNFTYNEQISAAYLTINQAAFKKLRLKYGIRAEHTHTKTNQKTGQIINTNSYANFLPYLSMNAALNERHNIRLSITTGIERPYYAQLNPFIYKTSDTYWNSGNPALVVAKRIGFDLSYVLKRRYVFYVRSFRLNNFIQENQVKINNDVTLARPINLDGHGTMTILGNSLEKKFFKEKLRFVLFNSFSIFNQKIKNIPASVKDRNFYYTCSMQLGFKDIAGSGIDFDSWSRIRTRQRLLDVNVDPTFNVNFSLQRSFPKQHFTITAAVSDILKKTNTYFERVTAAGTFGNLGYYDTRSIRLSIACNFGSGKIKDMSEKNNENGSDRMTKPPRSGGL